jgi:alginate O-acetyltransferase complex protein AlgI
MRWFSTIDLSFQSVSFLVFLSLVYISVMVIRDRGRWTVLLFWSIVFYVVVSKSLHLLIVLSLVTLFTYKIGILLAQSNSAFVKKKLLMVGVTGNILVLVSLKYLPFVCKSFQAIFGPDITKGIGLASLGVSYFTFQAISYLVDIYLEIEEPERHLGYFALYLAFFPKLLQGPIERAGSLLPQLKQTYVVNSDNLRIGLLMFSWGLFKKVVVADRLALYVNPVYNNVHDYSGFVLILVTYLYALQIYFDFSGYTDMALGVARLFNIKLTQNFNGPYQARSIADFWRRWHISFSRWILDYLFKPLQMEWRRWRMAGSAAALLVTFLVSGLWHGATWGFVVWGLIHGIYLAGSLWYKPYQKRIHKMLGVENSRFLGIWQTTVTFHLVCFSWIFFRASSLKDAWYIVTSCFKGLGPVANLVRLNGSINATLFLLYAAVALVMLFMNRNSMLSRYFENRSYARILVFYFLIINIILFRVCGGKTFIYTQF